MEKELYPVFCADKFADKNIASKWLGVKIRKEKNPTEKDYIFEIRPN